MMKQFFVEIPDQVGALSKLAGLFNTAGVNIEGITATHVSGTAHFFFCNSRLE